MQIVLAFFTLGSFRWECLLLSTVSFPIYTRALFNVLTGRETHWHVTGGHHRLASPFAFMIPQVLLFTFLLPTSFVAVWRDLNHSQLTLATVWNITNTIILGAFIAAAFRELAHRRRPGTAAQTEFTAEPARPGLTARPLEQADVMTRDDLVPAGSSNAQEGTS
jgi:cellulose synthase (UDP-forming)